MGAPSSKQLDLARQLGVDVTDDMDEYTLSEAISNAPATEDQVTFATSLLAFLGHALPENLTFGDAKRLLDDVAPHVNERVLMDEAWEEGDVLLWRDSYLLVETVHANRSFTLLRVELVRPAPGGPLTVEKTRETRKVRHPFTLHGEATKIDLATHQP